jgi:hypothetical protein
MKEWEDKIRPELEAEIERKQKIFEDESRKFNAIKDQKNQEYKEIESKAKIDKRRTDADAV